MENILGVLHVKLNIKKKLKINVDVANIRIRNMRYVIYVRIVLDVMEQVKCISVTMFIVHVYALVNLLMNELSIITGV